MQLTFQDNKVERLILWLEKRGFTFRVVRWQDRETFLIYRGKDSRWTRAAVKYLKRNNAAVREYLDDRARVAISKCRAILGG